MISHQDDHTFHQISNQSNDIAHEKKRYNTGGSTKLYVPSFFSEKDCIVGLNNYDAFDQQPLITPDEVVISTKNLIFEVYNGENHLLSSLKYTLRVCTANCGLLNMWVKLELICGITNTPITCVKKEKKGKRGIKGRCYQDFDLSKVCFQVITHYQNMYVIQHGYTKAKLEFRFRETSSEHAVSDKFRLNVHIFNESTLLLTFRSPRFRTVVRSPQRGRNKSKELISIPKEIPSKEIQNFDNNNYQRNKRKHNQSQSNEINNDQNFQWHNFEKHSHK